MKFLERAVRKDPRVELVLEDLPTDVHLQMFADADVCMAPARWEGLGLHLYEAIAFGQPIVCNDDAPMNELVVDGVNGILVPSHDDGLANSGIPARTVDVDALTDAISRLADPDLRAELSAGALRTRDERNWDRTVADFASLADPVAQGVCPAGCERLRVDGHLPGPSPNKAEGLVPGAAPVPPVVRRFAYPSPVALFSKKTTLDRLPVPFIVGVGRSGTTMLRLMLDAHPDLAIPPETHFVPDLIDAIDGGASPEQAVETMTAVRQWGDLDTEPADVVARWQQLDPFAAGPALRCFYEIYAERQGEAALRGEDPRLRQEHAQDRAGPAGGAVHPRDPRRPRRRPVPLEADARRQGPRPRIAGGRGLAAADPPGAEARAARLQHYLELRYEDLVTDTEPNLRRIAGFLELEWDPGMLTYYEHAAERMAEMARDLPATDGKPTRPGEERMQAHAMTQKPPDPSAMYRWKEKMSATDVAAFDAAAGELLGELGYEVGAGVPGAGAGA